MRFAQLIACAAVLLFTICQAASAAKFDPNTLQWEVRILIDTSMDLFGEPQQNFPRDNRGLAISLNGQFLYAGYNNSKDPMNGADRGGEVRRIDLSKSGFIDPWVTQLVGRRGKAIAVDDFGRVYLAEGPSIEVYSADLSTNLFSIGGLSNTNGVAAVRESGQLVLYSSDRNTGDLSKRLLTESGGAGGPIISAALDAGFGTAGNLSLTSSDLRGVEIGPGGNVWVAALSDDKLFRVSPSGGTIDSTTLESPFDIGFNGDQVLVTHNLARLVSIFDISEFEGDSIGGSAFVAPPWDALTLAEIGNVETLNSGSLTGIVVVPDQGFFLSNENGQTADQKSLYGEPDANSGFDMGTFFIDLIRDDNEPILFAAIPEPSAVILGTIGLFALLFYARRKRQVA